MRIGYFPPEAIRQAALENVGRVQVAINSYITRRPDLADWIHLPENLVECFHAAVPDPSGVALIVDEGYCLYLLADQGYADSDFQSPSFIEIKLDNGNRLMLGLI
jgi:hypothetical protein